MNKDNAKQNVNCMAKIEIQTVRRSRAIYHFYVVFSRFARFFETEVNKGTFIEHANFRAEQTVAINPTQKSSSPGPCRCNIGYWTKVRAGALSQIKVATPSLCKGENIGHCRTLFG